MGRDYLAPSEIKAKKIISSNLNDLLSKSGKRKTDIQRETNIPRSTISDYFGGKTLPSKENIEKLSKVFSVSPADIDPRYTNAPTKSESVPTDADLEEMLDNAHSFDGKPMTEHDREIIKSYLQGYFQNKD